MRTFDTCKASRAKPRCLVGLLAAIFLCAFHLAAVARVVNPPRLRLHTKASNDIVPHDYGKQVSCQAGDMAEMTD